MTPKIDPALHQEKKPSWIKVRLPSNPVFWSTKGLISDLKLHTVCEEAQCPNRWECWSQGTATFMIAGDRCTRACGFCAVKTAKPFALETDEPARVATATKRMKLKHVVITAVARDDLADGGALHFAQTIEAVRQMEKGLSDDGVIIVNLISALEGDGAKFLQAELRTYKEVFPTVYVFKAKSEKAENLAQNTIIVATKSDKIKFEATDETISASLKNHYQKPLELSLPILTDDLAPVEYYNSLAQRWTEK